MFTKLQLSSFTDSVVRNDTIVNALLISVHTVFTAEEGTLFPISAVQVGYTRCRLEDLKILKTQSALRVTHLDLSDM